MLTSLFMLLLAAPEATVSDMASIVLPVQSIAFSDSITDQDGFVVDKIAWTDGMDRRRSASMVHNDQQDPMGFWGGYMRSYTMRLGQSERVCTGSLKEHPGFGYTVNHYHGGVNSSRRYKGESYRYLLKGPHHVILEQSWSYPVGDGNIRATVQWLFATGRTHPLYAVTFDSSLSGPDVVEADARAPYGDIGWDGDAQSPVDGVGWGDRYKFKTTGGPVTPATGWDYTKRNTVPYTVAYSTTADGEMGLVQTQTIDQHDAGGYDGYKLWGTRAHEGPMPEPQSWPYQLNQWELPYVNTSKRMAWGMNYGAVGQTAYTSLGGDRVLSGYPYQSYSTFVVVGLRSRREVKHQVQQVEAIQSTKLTVCGAGAALLKGPGGVGRSDDVEWDLPGYNPVYGTFEARYQHNDGNKPITFQFNVAPGHALTGTVLVVHDWQGGTPQVTINNKVWQNNRVTFATVDKESHTLWLSYIEPINPGDTTIELRP